MLMAVVPRPALDLLEELGNLAALAKLVPTLRLVRMQRCGVTEHRPGGSDQALGVRMLQRVAGSAIPRIFHFSRFQPASVIRCLQNVADALPLSANESKMFGGTLKAWRR